MAAPLLCDAVAKISTIRQFISPLALLQHCAKTGSAFLHNDVGHKMSTSSLANRMICSNGTTKSSTSLLYLRPNTHNKPLFPASAILGLTPALPCCVVPSRSYGRKRIQKPPKINNFDYSGDLRVIPELDNNLVLYKYKGMEDEIENNEVAKKLSTLEFASAKEKAEHRKQLITDRIMELFGPDCQLEMKVALLTLSIRQKIPYCIKYRHDKVRKVQLLKNIASRRRLLTELWSTDLERLNWLLKELKIQYVVPKDREEYKGWKHNLRVATIDEVTNKKRQKLEELKQKFEKEKQVFFEKKAKVFESIEEDLNKFGLTWDDLNNLIAKDKEKEAEAIKLQRRQAKITGPLVKSA